MKFEKIDFGREYADQEEVLNILCRNNNILYKKLKTEELCKKASWLITGVCFIGYGYFLIKDVVNKQKTKEKDKQDRVDILNAALEESKIEAHE